MPEQTSPVCPGQKYCTKYGIDCHLGQDFPNAVLGTPLVSRFGFCLSTTELIQLINA